MKKRKGDKRLHGSIYINILKKYATLSVIKIFKRRNDSAYDVNTKFPSNSMLKHCP